MVGVVGKEGEVPGGGELGASGVEREDGGRFDPELGEAGAECKPGDEEDEGHDGEDGDGGNEEAAEEGGPIGRDGPSGPRGVVRRWAHGPVGVGVRRRRWGHVGVGSGGWVAGCELTLLNWVAGHRLVTTIIGAGG